MNNFNSSFMAKQCYWMIDNINTKSLPLEQIKIKLKWNFYELNKFWIYFYTQKPFSKLFS
jgi:hypothetical protein